MKREAGFNLTELMVVVAIVAVLLGIGIPSFRYVTNANRASAEVNGLLGDLMYARAEAVREGTPVVVCTSADSQNCAGAAVKAWQGGWIICVANAALTCDNTTAVLRVQKAFTSTDTLVGNVAAITFSRVGFATGLPVPAGATVTLHDKTSNAVWTRCLSVSTVGLLNITTHVTSPATCT